MRRRALTLAAGLLLGVAPPPGPLARAMSADGFRGVVLAERGGAAATIVNSGPAAQGPDAVWRYASVTKQLTALIAMQEVAAGRLDLDRPIRDYWPDWPQVYADRITPRMLLRHDSGLADPAEDGADADGMPHFYRSAAAAPDDAASGFCAEHPRAQPASGFHYDNCDFLVLGALLEHITGRPYATLVRERIAGPLGLRSIGQFAFGAPPPANVPGIDPRGKPDPAVNLGAYGAAGGLYGTPRDLLAFDRALIDRRLLGADATATMWQGEPKLGYAAPGAWSFTAALKGCDAPVALVERRGQIGSVQIRNVIAPALGAALVAFTARGDTDFGEVWRGDGLAYDLLSAAFCAGRAA